MPKSEIAPIRIASVLLLLAISVLTLVGCLGEEGETTGTGEETATAELPARNVALTQSRDSGVVGNANITDTPGGVEVAVAVEGLRTEPGTLHVAYIHEGGTCADDRAENSAPVKYRLGPLITQQDGTASSATSIEGVTLEQLTSGAPKYVNVHAEPTGEGVRPGIACADLAGTGGEAMTSAGDVAWVDDEPPEGARLSGEGDGTWKTVYADPTPFSGTTAHQSNIVDGVHQHFFDEASDTLSVNRGERLFAYVYLDPANMPEEVMLQWNLQWNDSWEHRAYWGENKLNWGEDGTESRRFMGPLPPGGEWVRLEVAASEVGLENREVDGMAFALYGGRATWDVAGKAGYG